MYFHLLYIIIFIVFYILSMISVSLIVIGYYIISYLLSSLFSLSSLSSLVSNNFECGFIAFYSSLIRFRLSYWLLIINFILFEIELILSILFIYSFSSYYLLIMLLILLLLLFFDLYYQFIHHLLSSFIYILFYSSILLLPFKSFFNHFLSFQSIHVYSFFRIFHFNSFIASIQVTFNFYF